MGEIGYAIFRITDDLMLDSSDMFDEFKLEDELIPDSSLLDLKSGERLIFFKRIKADGGRFNSKRNGYLIVLLENISQEDGQIIIGSAVCYKNYGVYEQKVIAKLFLLLKDLKKNFDFKTPEKNMHLDVLLPGKLHSQNVFRETKLVYKGHRNYKNQYNTLPIEQKDIPHYLHLFCTHEKMSDIGCLLFNVTHSNRVIAQLKDTNFSGINMHLQYDSKDIDKLNQVLSKKNEQLQSRNKRITRRNQIISTIAILFCLSSIFMYINSEETPNKEKEIYPIERYFYVNNKHHHVNVRSIPANKEEETIQSTLSDGDKVEVIGVDKNSLWLKIKYNNQNEEGYISNRYVTKEMAKHRLRSVQKTAYIKQNAYLFNLPKFNSDKLTSLSKGNTIFIKNQELKNNDWYSVRVDQGNKTYNGYLNSIHFSYNKPMKYQVYD
ncbi:SH3 domain-containing protein [Tenacibaculum xiamenense]|uniref:SH3 domain-containing protein n=1 Tax=Tenacibaculum xiamenense TaxID=1261553 RepID=UPI003895D9F3